MYQNETLAFFVCDKAQTMELSKLLVLVVVLEQFSISIFFDIQTFLNICREY